MPLPDVLVWFPVERELFIDAKTEMWGNVGGNFIFSPFILGLDADGFYNPNPLLYPDFIAARDGLAVSSLVGGQRELFIRWGNGADKTGILSVTDENGTEVVRRRLIRRMTIHWLKNLAPGTTYHVALLKSDDAVLWKDDVKTKSVNRKVSFVEISTSGWIICWYNY